jgi:aspartyl-tRNA(Asn)/glutamyl-tRNA(Gln) amidotransferase subunit A
LFHFESIAAYHKALLEGITSCEEAVHYYLEKIRTHQELNSFLHVYDREALERARSLDESRKINSEIPPLHGVVISLKDVIAYRDHPLQAASAILSGYRSSFDATAVQHLLEAGAIIIGNNNCDEFAMGSSNENSAFGPVLNALNPERVPGGSSGGSAVAVQAGLCMASLGSDTGGSVRQPADFCGIVGLKPTYGRVSRYGLIAYGSSFDQIGIFTKNVADATLILSIISGNDDFDATSADNVPPVPKSLSIKTEDKPTVGYFKQMLHHPSLDTEIKKNIELFIRRLLQDGYTVKELDFELIDYIVPTYYVLTTAEASSNLSRYDGIRYGTADIHQKDLPSFYAKNRTNGFGKEVQRRILLGTFVLSAGHFDAYFTKAQQVRRILLEQTNQVFKEVDLLISPVSPETAFKIGEKTTDPLQMYLADIYTVFANLTGIPAISIPMFKHSNGLPYSIQLMSNHFGEESMLNHANNWMNLYRYPVI